MEDLTYLLQAVRAGDHCALGQMFSVMYEELCSVARRQLRRVSRNSALDTTSLVHECYLRLARTEPLVLYDRSHFLGYAARVMRSVAVDSAREACAQRRSTGKPLVTTPIDIPDHKAVTTEELLLLNKALADLACSQERLAHIVTMRYFSGFTVEQIAQNLGVAERTIRRDWEKARCLLAVALS